MFTVRMHESQIKLQDGRGVGIRISEGKWHGDGEAMYVVITTKLMFVKKIKEGYLRPHLYPTGRLAKLQRLGMVMAISGLIP